MGSLSDNTLTSNLLSPAEAAHFLGVTAELLFAYALYPPKKGNGQNLTLPYNSEGDRHGFLREDLESFDYYLRQPWSDDGAPRPSLPSYIGDYLKVESSGQCARCGRGFKLENAHIIPYSESRSHHHHNLIRLCVQCHEDFHTNKLVTLDEIRVLKHQLVARVRERLTTYTNSSCNGIGTLPNPASQFIGREHDLGHLVEALSHNRSIVIEGPGGIGKTQLLLNALKLSTDSRPTLWINLEAYKTVKDLELAIFLALSRSGMTISANSIIEALVDINIRLVFDGVEQMATADMDELEDFFSNLLTMTVAPQFVFTSQLQIMALDLEIRFELEPISREASELILLCAVTSEIQQIPEEKKSLCDLVEFCQGHPLSLSITAGLIRFYKLPSSVMARIQMVGSAAVQSPTRSRQNARTSLRCCLLVSYYSLTLNQKKLLWLASQCPAGLLMHNTDNNQFGVEDIATVIAVLARWHLVDLDVLDSSISRLSVLSPIRAFVDAELRAEIPEEINEIEHLLLVSLTFDAGIIDQQLQNGEVRTGLLRFDMEFPNFSSALQQSAKLGTNRALELTALMASSLMVYCFLSGFVDRGIEIMRIGAEAAVRIGKIRLASQILTRLLLLAGRSYNIHVIESAAKELTEIAAESTDLILLANAHFGEGMVAMINRNLGSAGKAFAAAAGEYQQSIRIVESKSQKSTIEGFANTIDSIEWLRHMQAITLKKQGVVHEKSNNTSEALAFYELALSLLCREKDQINFGSVMHHIGNCAANSGQFDKALESYLASAKQFQLINYEEYISNSLGELGYLFIEWNPPKPVEEYVKAELFIDGLDDVVRQVERIFPSLAYAVPGYHYVETIRKVFGMIALASFTSYNYILSDWASYLREEILRPLFNNIDLENVDFSIKLLLMHLDLALAIAGTISEVEQPEGIGSAPNQAEVEYLARLCYKFFDWGWEAFHLFEWLSVYLCRHRGGQRIDPHVLRLAAEASESGSEFTVHV